MDALDEQAVNHHADRVVKSSGTLDVSFNLINLAPGRARRWWTCWPMILCGRYGLQCSRSFSRPRPPADHVATALGCGSLADGHARGIGYPMVGGFGPACCAIEAFSRNLAAELGPHGVRVVNIRSAGSPDSRPFRQAAAQGGPEVREFFARLKNDTMLKEMPLMKDIANAAVFLASDLAGKITGVTSTSRRAPRPP